MATIFMARSIHEGGTVRASQLLLTTRRDAPADASTASHALLVRSGMIRPLADGIHVHGPLMVRVLRRIESIVGDELEAIGYQELAVPVVQPRQLLEESGRWRHGAARSEFTIEDRTGAAFVVGSAHDEVVTAYLRDQVRSYRQLPLRLHHRRTTIDDQRGKRSGLLRGRESVVLQAASFDLDATAMQASFEAVVAAYERLLRRIGLDATKVEVSPATRTTPATANPGATGSERAGAFVVLTPAGDVVVAVSSNGIAATLDTARTKPTIPADPAEEPMQEVSTPGAHTVEQLRTAIPDVPVERTVKTLLYEAIGAGGATVVAAVCRGDRAVNEAKLAAAIGADEVQLAGDATVRVVTGAQTGFAGPVGLPPDVRLVVDPAAAAVKGFVCGANRTDIHLRDVWWGRDVEVAEVADIDLVKSGDVAADGGTFELARGIEVGRVTAVGTAVTAPMGLRVLDAEGAERDVWMGSYRIELTRLVSAVAEAHNQDDRGMVWPPAVAPFGAVIVQTRPGDPAQDTLAELLHGGLHAAGCDPLWDDRTERPGVKFNDADLIGAPLRLTVGREAAQGRVELLDRRTGEQQSVATDDAVRRARELLH